MFHLETGRVAIDALRTNELPALLTMLGGAGAALAVAAVGQTFLPPDLSVPVPWMSVALAIGVSSLKGLLFGYLPANVAAKLQPTDSLCYE